MSNDPPVWACLNTVLSVLTAAILAGAGALVWLALR